MKDSVASLSNPLLEAWTGPYGGVPPFDRLGVGHFKPALERAMASQLGAVESIAANAEPPSFDNTIAAMERAGRALDRVARLFNVFGRSMSTPDFQAVEREMAPELAAFEDRILQDERLFRRVAAVHEAAGSAGLTPEQRRLAWLRYMEFVRSGARLEPAGKARLAAINRRLAALYTRFTQNVLADEARHVLYLAASDLEGLGESLAEAAAAAARERGQDGRYAILNTRSSVEPFLAFSARRDLRERVWRAFASRGDNGDAHDNKAVVAEIARLRAERARLLGYESHAHWRLEMSMARDPRRASALLEAVWKPARERVAADVAEMQAIADRDGAGVRIAPWDVRYYAEKLRRARYDVDEEELKPYLQLENLREAMFWVAGELLGLRFTAASGVPVYHPDVRVWQVHDETGRHAGLFYFDPYAREGKVSGAWMNAYRSQEGFEGDVAAIVSNNSNFVRGAAGRPVLVTWDDARTLFHEFGHALHGLSSRVAYPSLSGTDVYRDYVEFPSQLLEHWLATPEVLERFARHCRTGEPMPAALVGRIEGAARFGEGLRTVEYLASAFVDLRLHLMPEPPADLTAFEASVLEDIGMPPQVGMRHRLAHFGHLFSGDGYSAGYYSYLWADTLTADAFEAFTSAGGAYDRSVASRLREHVLSKGNTVDPEEGYRAFRGRDPRVEALMRKRGFPAVSPT